MNSDTSSNRSETDYTQSAPDRIVEFNQETDSATETIVRTVAERANTSPTSLDPLFDVVDPESLDGVVRSVATRSSASSAEVTFRYHGYTVTVHSHGVVEVCPVNRD